MNLDIVDFFTLFIDGIKPGYHLKERNHNLPQGRLVSVEMFIELLRRNL